MNIKNLFLITIICLFISCSKESKDICIQMQLMAERCEPEILAIFHNDNIQNESQGRTAFDYQLLESRIKKKIAQKEGQKQCEKFRNSKETEYIKRYKMMKDCAEKKNCKEFANCIITF